MRGSRRDRRGTRRECAGDFQHLYIRREDRTSLVLVEARFWDMWSPVRVFGTRPFYSLPHMEVVHMNTLHNPCIYKVSFNFLYEIAKASDIQIVLVCFLLIMRMKGQEELRSFRVVLVVRYKIQGVTVIIVPCMKAS